MTELDATARPILATEREVRVLRGLAAMAERKHFKKDAETALELIKRWDGAEHLAVVDRKTALAVDSRDSGRRRPASKRKSG